VQAIILLDATSGFQQSVWRASVAKLRAESDPAREQINAKNLIRCSCALDMGTKAYMSRRFSRAARNVEIFLRLNPGSDLYKEFLKPSLEGGKHAN
jgi:hypothetical protein